MAEDYNRRAQTLFEKQAPGSLLLADTFYQLALTARLKGDLQEAEAHSRRGLAIQEKVVPYLHPQIAANLKILAEILAEKRQSGEALKAALRAEGIGREHLRLTVRTLPERQALLYASARPAGLDLALTLAAEGKVPDSGGQVLDALIRSRAVVFDEIASRHHRVRGIEDPEIARLVRELTAARERLARLVVRGPRNDPSDLYRDRLERARKDKERAEQTLAEKSLAFREELAKGRVGVKEVASALPLESALVGIVRYGAHVLTGERPAEKAHPKPTPSCLAAVLRAGESHPKLVPLGPAQEIESLVSRWRERVTQEALAGGSSKRSEVAYRAVALKLRQKIWDPLAPHLQGAKRVFVVPDGALHLVNFAALPVGRTGYLVESGPLIHYLSAERDLVPISEPEAKGSGLLALGNPAFDETKLFAALSPARQALPAAGPLQMAAVSGGTRSACGKFESMRFEPLPASAEEAREIAALWQEARESTRGEGQRLRGIAQAAPETAIQLTGVEANEVALKAKAPGKRVLHVATHAFFLGGRCASALDASAKPKGGIGPAAVVDGENPLLLAGLVLAGANHRQTAGPEEEDGILTAEEIVALNLEGTELAVLSGCDTGVGEVKAGEGVFGIRRAFQLAGARAVIMSLWPVEDEAARKWMTTLYRQRFLRGFGTAESVRQASLSLLHDRRSNNQSTHPFYWAGFVAVGDWR